MASMAWTRREFLARTGLGMGAMAAAMPAMAWGAPVGENLVMPAQLAERLRRRERVLILQVGFATLYRAAHIPGSEYAGPASKAKGLAALRHRLGRARRDRAVVLYCGCCPWRKCPNIHPAAAAARQLGWRRIELLYLPDSFAQDWVRAGYPAAGRDFPTPA